MAVHLVKLAPFPVPTAVRVQLAPGLRQDGMKPLPEILLSDLSVETLEELCREFRASVFDAAGKTRPEFADPHEMP